MSSDRGPTHPDEVAAYHLDWPRERGLRASDQDRDAVAAILQREHVGGRIDADEFQERLDACLSARTYAELDALIADLPQAPSQMTRRSRSWRVPPVLAIVPLLVVAIALTDGRLAWLAFPVFFFVIRPVIYRRRGWGRGGWGPGSVR